MTKKEMISDMVAYGFINKGNCKPNILTGKANKAEIIRLYNDFKAWYGNNSIMGLRKMCDPFVGKIAMKNGRYDRL